MSYYICGNQEIGNAKKGCGFPIKMGPVYQVGDLYFHETCRPSYVNENWKQIVEHSMEQKNYTSEGFAAWLLRDWDYREIGVFNRRKAKVAGLHEADIISVLIDWKKPVCEECKEYVFPWEPNTYEEGKFHHNSCLMAAIPS